MGSLETLLQDLRYAVRNLVRAPGFTAVVVITLALGIGANSAIFTVVNAVVLRSLPYEEPDELVRLFYVDTESGERHGSSISAPDFMSFREESRALRDLVAYTPFRLTLTGAGDPQSLDAAEVSAGFFEILGIQPSLGRAFRPAENEPGADEVVILGHGLWQQSFGGEPDIIGRTLVLNGEAHVVVGVAPPDFDFPGGRDLWIPLEYDEYFSSETAANRRSEWLSVLGRLRAGVSPERAGAEAGAIAERLERAFPETNTNIGATIVPLRDVVVGEARTPLLILLGAVGFVLLIACVNIANLLLSRAASREGEFAVRTALGAERGRLVRQLLTESTLLGLVAGSVGLLVALWGTRALVLFSPPGVPRLDEVGIDLTVVVFTAGVSILTGLLFGLAPALLVGRSNLASSLRAGGRGGMDAGGSGRMRSGLVVAEISLAVVLLVGAGLLARSFLELQRVDPGFRSEQVLAFDLSLPASSYEGYADISSFYERALDRMRALPGVTSAGAVVMAPLTGNAFVITFDVEGREARRAGEEVSMEVRIATPGYFRTVAIPVRRGRGFTERDRADAPPVVVINEAAVRSFFPGEDPLGRRILLGWTRDSVQMGGEVVGVVGDTREYGLAAEPPPMIFLPYAQAPVRPMDVLLRTSGDPLALADPIRRTMQELDPDLPVSNLRTLEAVVSESFAQPRFYALLLGFFATTALALAGIGIFGVMSFSVAQRTREIGIKIALGADSNEVLWQVVRDALVLAGVGLAGGLAGALVLTGVLESQLYGIPAVDPLTYVAVIGVLGTAAFLASYLPARRAAQTDPMIALRAD